MGDFRMGSRIGLRKSKILIRFMVTKEISVREIKSTLRLVWHLRREDEREIDESNYDIYNCGGWSP